MGPCGGPGGQRVPEIEDGVHPHDMPLKPVGCRWFPRSLCAPPTSRTSPTFFFLVVKIPGHDQDLDMAEMTGAMPPTPALWTAAEEGQTEELRRLLLEGAAIEERGGLLESSPLHVAADSGHAGCVTLLLEQRADVSTKANDDYSPLHDAAVRLGEETIVQLLLEHSAEVSAKTKNGYTPLHYATRREEITIVRREAVVLQLLEAGADASATTDDGSFPLLFAAEEGFEGVAQLLLQHRADVSARAMDGFTALHVLAPFPRRDEGREDMVRLLRTSGADRLTAASHVAASMMSAAGDIQLCACCFHWIWIRDRTTMAERPFVVVRWKERRRWCSCFSRWASQHDWRRASDPLRSSSHDFDLHHGHAVIANLLSNAGADVSIKTEVGATALHKAAALGHAGMVQVLLEHGADASCKTDCGCTPLHHAGMAVIPEPRTPNTKLSTPIAQTLHPTP